MEMKMSLQDNLILKQLRSEFDNGNTISSIEIKEAGTMECCQTDEIKYHVLSVMGISPKDIFDIAKMLITNVTCAAMIEIYYGSGFTDQIMIGLPEIKNTRFLKMRIENYFDTYELNVKKIIVTRLVKSSAYPDIVVPHKTIVRVVK